MIKDLPKSLISAVAEIGKKSQQAYAEEQRKLVEKSTMVKQLGKMKPVAQGHADPAAVKGAAKMAEGAEGTVPKTPKEKALAALSEPKDKITHADVMKGRGVKKEEANSVQEASTQDEYDAPMHDRGDVVDHPKLGKVTVTGHTGKDMYGGFTHYKVKTEAGKEHKVSYDSMHESSNPFDPNYKSQMPSKPGEKAGFDSKKTSTGMVYTRKPPKKDAMKENTDTPGNNTHQCAIHVKSEQFGEGKTLFSQHAEPDTDGNIAWYDVMFEHGIEKRVPVEQLEILVSESHMDHKKKAKK